MIKINWNPTDKDIRNFGWVILGGFGLIGLVLFLRHHQQTAVWMWGVSVGIFSISFMFPQLAKPFYWAWMGIAFVIGGIVSRIMLCIIFFVIVTPVALYFKIVGRDVLKIRKPSNSSESYWIDHPEIKDPTYYEHLF